MKELGVISDEVADAVVHAIDAQLHDERDETTRVNEQRLAYDAERSYQARLLEAKPLVDLKNYKGIVSMIQRTSGTCLIRDVRVQKMLIDAILDSGEIDFMARIFGSIDYFDYGIRESVMKELLTKATSAQLVLAINYVGKISDQEVRLCNRLLEIGKVEDFIRALNGFSYGLDRSSQALMDRIFENEDGVMVFVNFVRGEQGGSDFQRTLLNACALHRKEFLLRVIDEAGVDVEFLASSPSHFLQRTAAVIKARNALKELEAAAV